MIIEAKSIENLAQLTTDVCIIGAGAAGIAIALELGRRGIDVTLLTGVHERETSSDRDMYRGVPDSSHPHEPLEENRRRAFGGTTIAWGGRCVPLDPIDFETRSWIPNSGWPISYEEVLPHFSRAIELCEAGPFNYDAAALFSEPRASIIDNFDDENIVATSIERWSPPTNFGKRYKADLRGAANIRVIMGGSVVHVQLDEGGQAVGHVVASAGGEHRFHVAGRAYVLATGGLENARLMLASDDVHRAGIGNSAGLVGRFYMSHLTSVAAKVTMAATRPALRSGFERDAAGVYCRRRFALTPFAQADRQVGNAIATLHRPPIGDAVHRDPVFSAMFLAKHYKGILRHGAPAAMLAELRASSDVQREHWNVITSLRPDSISPIVQVLRQRYLARRRLPSVLGNPLAAEQHILYQIEHAPHPDSRVSLSGERDAFGLRRITVRPAIGDVEAETIIELHRLLGERFEKTGIGQVEAGEAELRAHVSGYLGHFNSQAHHLGTTRMSERPETGVVDANCEVHGVHGLFVAGGSVFPTGGHANPTLTIVALSVRLAAHLAQELASRA
jgi:choline dehydrogenase-like flavoprotein